MKKSFSVNISGVIFQVDEDAYEQLHRYLDRLNLHFANTEGKEEIITDIEQRIAEMLSQKLGDHRVVTNSHIGEVISALGEPVDFDDGPSEDPQPGRRYRRRLYRDPDDKVLGGVAGGMGSYFNTDPLWFRIAFIVLTIFGGSGLLIYLILWLIIPEARTAADRLEMRGEEININNIERTIKEEMADIRRRFGHWKDEGGRKKKDDARRVISSGGQILVTLFWVFFKVMAILIGIALVAGTAALILSLVLPGITFHRFPLLFDVSLQELLTLIIGTPGMAGLALTASLLVVLLPLVALLWTGIRLIFNYKSRQRWLGGLFSTIWGISILFLVVIAVITINDFSTKGYHDDRAITMQSLPDTLTVGLIPPHHESYFTLEERSGQFRSMYVTYDKNSMVLTGEPEIRFRQSHDNMVTIIVSKKARGSSRRAAEERAADIRYNTVTDSNAIRLGTLFNLPDDAIYRGQHVTVTLFIPEGKPFTCDNMLQQKYRMIENFDPLWDQSLPGKVLVMKNHKLEVAD
jgi:phage shock protein PspC (stress-responsive transcriptional regulator)